MFAGRFLDRLQSPLLKTLQFSSLGSAHQLKSFLVRSKPPLTSLTVTALIDVAELFHSLRYASALAILRIREDPVVWGQQVERLKLGSPINENICPALEFIGFEGCIGGDMKYLEEVLSRWKGPNDATASPKSTKGPECATDGGWMRNLGRVYVDDWMHAQSPDSRFTARPRIRKSVEEGLVVFEDYPYGSDFWL
ncbi:hypothetical protein BD410DRAFT_635191 [Rickenella mellea]|uniref:F-box domain-containing protein n=1 Tax=Rickenella mellea TaxID=50990 RepID=A0A4Y7QDG3_9AGAM|nr:hypothetical protein BD410DRAFT_635191 [Rickenella mellea]